MCDTRATGSGSCDGAASGPQWARATGATVNADDSGLLREGERRAGSDRRQDGSGLPVINTLPSVERPGDPYPLYARVRAENPVHLGPCGEIVVSRYADCVRVLLDQRASSEPGRASRASGFVGSRRASEQDPVALYERLRGSMLIFSDDPLHSRLRGLLGRALGPRALSSRRPTLERLVHGVFERAAQRGRIEIMREVADVLPGEVIDELYGVPSADRASFRAWARELSRLAQSPLVRRLSPAAEAALCQMQEYMASLIEDRRRSPGDDLLSELCAAERGSDRLSDWELLATSLLVVIAAQETTRNLIGNGVALLVRNPDQARLARSGAGLLANTVEEAARMDSPVQLVGRVATEEMRIGDLTARPGQQIAVVIASANRDEAVFREPDRFDVARPSATRHLAFSLGAHFCAGATLARMQTAMVYTQVLRRFPRLEAAGPIRHVTSPVFRAVESLELVG